MKLNAEHKKMVFIWIGIAALYFLLTFLCDQWDTSTFFDLEGNAAIEGRMK